MPVCVWKTMFCWLSNSFTKNFNHKKKWPFEVLGDQNSVYYMLQYTDKIKVNWMPRHNPQDSKVTTFLNVNVDQKITSGQPWEILSAKNDERCGIMNGYNIPDLSKKWVDVKWEFQRKFRYCTKVLSHSFYDPQICDKLSTSLTGK